MNHFNFVLLILIILLSIVIKVSTIMVKINKFDSLDQLVIDQSKDNTKDVDRPIRNTSILKSKFYKNIHEGNFANRSTSVLDSTIVNYKGKYYNIALDPDLRNLAV